MGTATSVHHKPSYETQPVVRRWSRLPAGESAPKSDNSDKMANTVTSTDRQRQTSTTNTYDGDQLMTTVIAACQWQHRQSRHLHLRPGCNVLTTPDRGTATSPPDADDANQLVRPWVPASRWHLWSAPNGDPTPTSRMGNRTWSSTDPDGRSIVSTLPLATAFASPGFGNNPYGLVAEPP